MKKRYYLILSLIFLVASTTLFLFFPRINKAVKNQSDSKITFIFPNTSDSHNSEIFLRVGYSDNPTSGVDYFCETNKKTDEVDYNCKANTKNNVTVQKSSDGQLQKKVVMFLPKSSSKKIQIGLYCNVVQGMNWLAMSKWVEFSNKDTFYVDMNMKGKVPVDFTSKGYVLSGNLYLKKATKEVEEQKKQKEKEQQERKQKENWLKEISEKIKSQFRKAL